MKKPYEDFTTSQVTVDATVGGTLLAASADGRDEVTIQQLGTTPVYIGKAGVTTATGFRLPGTDGASITLPATTGVYGITASGSQAVAVLVTG